MSNENPESESNPENTETIPESIENEGSGSERVTKRTKKVERILEYDARSNLLIPAKWKYPYSFKKRDYIAIIIGLDIRYEFERYFCEKTEFEIEDGDKREIGLGFKKEDFKDDLVIEERYSYKEGDSFITKLNYYKAIILDDGVYGEPLSKSEVREELALKQQMIYDRFKGIMNEFGEEYTIYTMKSILKQKDQITKKVSFTFF